MGNDAFQSAIRIPKSEMPLMNRLLTIAFIVLGVLIAADRLFQMRQNDRRVHASHLRPLAASPAWSAEKIKQVQIARGVAATPWTYRRRDGTWRYPANFDAYAQADRIEQLLGGILQSLGTIVSTDPAAAAHYGLAPEQALIVRLADAPGADVFEVWVGRAVPGRDTGESYMKTAGSDTIYHMHANPRLALQPIIPGKPPMVDPYVLPRALARKPIVRITYGQLPRTLRRVETAPPRPLRSGQLPEGPIHEWYGTFGGREQTCNNASVYAFTGFLSRLRYEKLHDHHAAGIDYGFASPGGKLYLKDEAGMVDTLETGNRDGSGNVYLRHRTTSQVFTITPRKAELLFPTARTLLDTLQKPSPYQMVEPPASFSFR